ncbi:MAG: undecaprenyl-diphosphate phosphatase [Bacillota bacterium]|jgi:undecaprenyl-diphosphatase|nr:undecaprenyl-diphosphate phosphatase [Candidatus Fermentithermobacillaceae bacterium]
MNWLQAVVLGVIQGLTEFLPVSSSGHLVLGARFVGLPSPGLSFSIWVHIGTAVATVVMLHKDIRWLAKNLFVPETKSNRSRALRIAGYLVAASVPAALVGLLLGDLVESAFSSPLVASAGLIVTGCFLQASRGKARSAHAQSKPSHELPTVTFQGAITVGILQAVAVIPGISRSGSTITAGLMSGMSREDAARFSFLLSLPAVFGSALLDISSALRAQAPVVSPYGLLGCFVSFVTGLLALGFVLRSVRQGELWKFSYYCWTVGICFLVLTLTRR